MGAVWSAEISAVLMLGKCLFFYFSGIGIILPHLALKSEHVYIRGLRATEIS